MEVKQKDVKIMETLTESCAICKREIDNDEYRGHIGDKTACMDCLDTRDRNNWRQLHGMAN